VHRYLRRVWEGWPIVLAFGAGAGLFVLPEPINFIVVFVVAVVLFGRGAQVHRQISFDIGDDFDTLARGAGERASADADTPITGSSTVKIELLRQDLAELRNLTGRDDDTAAVGEVVRQYLRRRRERRAERRERADAAENNSV